LEDKEKMIAALTTAGKKRDNAIEAGSDTSPHSRRTSHQRSEGSSGSLRSKNSLASPQKSERELADVTRMLDEMISGRVDNASRRGART